jgi:hypothetical protein
MGKKGASTNTQVGYKKETKEYKEGDVWTENKKTWTIKNGIKQTISKLDAIKKEVFMPLCCPKCNKVMKKRLDKPNYRIHKKCYNCVIEFEHKLQLQSQDKYLEYLKNLEIKNSFDILKETEEQLLGLVNNISNKSYVSEDGVIERWVGGKNKKTLIDKVKSEFKIERENLKKQINDKERIKRVN